MKTYLKLIVLGCTALSLVAASCNEEGITMGNPVSDADSSTDASVDASTPSNPDAGNADAGSTATDAGVADAGSADAGSPDAGTPRRPYSDTRYVQSVAINANAVFRDQDEVNEMTMVRTPGYAPLLLTAAAGSTNGVRYTVTMNNSWRRYAFTRTPSCPYTSTLHNQFSPSFNGNVPVAATADLTDFLLGLNLVAGATRSLTQAEVDTAASAGRWNTGCGTLSAFNLNGYSGIPSITVSLSVAKTPARCTEYCAAWTRRDCSIHTGDDCDVPDMGISVRAQNCATDCNNAAFTAFTGETTIADTTGEFMPMNPEYYNEADRSLNIQGVQIVVSRPDIRK